MGQNKLEQFRQKGWVKFDFDPVLYRWVEEARIVSEDLTKNPEYQYWYRYQQTWFAGVNIFPNTKETGALNGVPLEGDALSFIRNDLKIRDFEWDQAQLSICYPGYPKPMDHESDGQFRFRKNRDAAHVDGLLPVGEKRQRQPQEWHRFLLGIPVSDYSDGASPFTIWEGSHKLMRDAFSNFFKDIPLSQWPTTDVTALYTNMRKHCFETLPRTKILAKPGECYLVDPLSLHGMAAWEDDAYADPLGRAILYFRPEFDSPDHWLDPLC